MQLATFKQNVNVRRYAGTSNDVLGVAKPGELGIVLGGPVIANSLHWYFIQGYHGLLGWSAQAVGTETLLTLSVTDAAFDDAVDFTLKWEGGYVNNPKDPGGETKFGISKRSYPWIDIPTLNVDYAKLIYYRDFWLYGGWDTYEWPKCAVLFDIGVLSGNAHAISLEELEPLKTISAHFKYLANLQGFDTFGRGWTRRTIDLMDLCL